MEGEDVGVLAGGDLKFDAVQLPGEVLVLADELLLLVVCLLEVGVVGGRGGGEEVLDFGAELLYLCLEDGDLPLHVLALAALVAVYGQHLVVFLFAAYPYYYISASSIVSMC